MAGFASHNSRLNYKTHVSSQTSHCVVLVCLFFLCVVPVENWISCVFYLVQKRGGVKGFGLLTCCSYKEFGIDYGLFTFASSFLHLCIDADCFG